MNRRLELHGILTDILGTTGKETTRVYFQPPSNIKMQYPCIVYSRLLMSTKYADDGSYNNRTCYSVIVIDPNPDSEIPGKIGALPLCQFDRHYTADNLNHDVYNIFY